MAPGNTSRLSQCADKRLKRHRVLSDPCFDVALMEFNSAAYLFQVQLSFINERWGLLHRIPVFIGHGLVFEVVVVWGFSSLPGRSSSHPPARQSQPEQQKIPLRRVTQLSAVSACREAQWLLLPQRHSHFEPFRQFADRLLLR